MRTEPVIVGQIVAALGLVALFFPAIREAIEAGGGETAFQAAVGTFVGIVTYFMRSKVSPDP